MASNFDEIFGISRQDRADIDALDAEIVRVRGPKWPTEQLDVAATEQTRPAAYSASSETKQPPPDPRLQQFVSNPPPDRAPFEGFGRELNVFLSGVNYEAIAKTLGLPVDLVTDLINLVPYKLGYGNILKAPFLSSNSIRSGMSALGIKDYQPTNRNEETLRQWGAEAGNTLLGATGVGLAGRAMQAGRLPIVPGVPQLTERLGFAPLETLLELKK